MEDKVVILNGVFQKFSTFSYPGRIYGMYIWDFDKSRWVIDEKFCKDNSILVK